MSIYGLNMRRIPYLWGWMVIVLLGGCSRPVSRTYEGASLVGRFTLKIGEIRQEKGYVYNPMSATTGEGEQDVFQLDVPRRFSETSPLWEDPLDVMRESLITQAKGTGLFKQVGMEVPSPDYVLSGKMQLLSSTYKDSLGMHMNYRTVLRADLEDVWAGAMIWSGEGIGATPLQIEHAVEISSSDSRETLAHFEPWLFAWSPDAISEAAQEVMKQVAAAMVEWEMERARGKP